MSYLPSCRILQGARLPHNNVSAVLSSTATCSPQRTKETTQGGILIILTKCAAHRCCPGRIVCTRMGGLADRRIVCIDNGRDAIHATDERKEHPMKGGRANSRQYGDGNDRFRQFKPMCWGNRARLWPLRAKGSANALESKIAVARQAPTAAMDNFPSQDTNAAPRHPTV